MEFRIGIEYVHKGRTAATDGIVIPDIKTIRTKTEQNHNKYRRVLKCDSIKQEEMKEKKLNKEWVIRKILETK